MEDPADRTREVFERAVRLPPDRRALDLDQACGGDSALRAAVEALLAGDDLARSLGAFSARGETSRVDPTWGWDTRGSELLGAYRLIETLGEGATGCVYRAEPTGGGPEVAVKVLHPGPPGRDAPGLLERERGLLASLDHPNVARLIDGGLAPDGRPYLVTEFAPGGRIDDYGLAHDLDVAGRVRLLAQACRAVAHAHRLGVVHRDLKPGNILVAADGSARVVDFGIARRVGGGRDPSITSAGQLAGTLGYMAPEQAEGSADAVGPRADVYALGAVLYELLTGRPPLAGRSLLDASRRLRDEEPIPPRRLDPSVPRDLEAVCLKCLEKDPKRRYADAGELADDLDRFLRGEPVQARRPGVARRALRWARRRPALAATAAALVITAAASFAAFTTLWREARVGEARARGLLGRALRVVALQAESARRELAGRGPLTPERQRSIREFIDAAEGLFDGDDEAGPEALAVRAEGYRAIARFAHELGDYERSVRLHRRAIPLLERLVAAAPREPGYRRDLARCHHQVACALSYLGRMAEAEGPRRRAVEEARALAALRPGEDETLLELATVEESLAYGLVQDGRPGEAEAHFRAAAGAADAFLARSPGDLGRRKFRSDVRRRWAELAMRRGDPAPYLKSMEEQLDLARAVRERSPDDPEATSGLLNHVELADLLRELGRPDDAEAAFRRGHALLRALAARFPALSFYRSRLASDLQWLGFLRRSQGDRAASGAAFRESLAILERLAADFPDDPKWKDALAQWLALCPDPALRDAGRAERLARELEERSPTDPRPRVLRGLSAYARGDWSGTARLLGPPAGTTRGTLTQWGATEELIRIMAEAREGDPGRARRAMALAEAEFRDRRRDYPVSAILRYFLAEARAMVGGDEAARALGVPPRP